MTALLTDIAIAKQCITRSKTNLLTARLDLKYWTAQLKRLKKEKMCGACNGAGYKNQIVGPGGMGQFQCRSCQGTGRAI